MCIRDSPNPHSVDKAETLALVFEDDQAALRLTLYYTAYEDRATITSFAKIENCSDETVVIHKALSVLADLPAGDYDILTLQGAYAREKTVRRQQVEQGIFSISSNPVSYTHLISSLIKLRSKKTSLCFFQKIVVE